MSEKSGYLENIQQSLDGIMNDFAEILPDGIGTDASLLGEKIGVEALLGEIVSIITGQAGEFLSFLLLLFGIAVIYSLASLMEGGFRDISIAGISLLLSTFIFSKVYPVFQSVREAFSSLSAFFSGVIPVIASYKALGGATKEAGTGLFGMQMTLSVYSAFSTSFLMTLVGLLFILGVLSTLQSSGISSLYNGVKNLFTKGVGLLTALFGGTLALESYIAKAADSLTMRSARYAMGSLIPIVGNTVSSALSTLSGGLSYLGGVIGVGSVLAILSICLSPLIVLVMYKLCLFLVSSFLNIVGFNTVSVISAFSGIFDCLISVYSMTITIYILEIVFFAMGGSAIGV